MKSQDLGWLREAVAASGISARALSVALGLSPTRLTADLAQGTLRWDLVASLAAALGVEVPARVKVDLAALRGAWWRADDAGRREAAGEGWRAVATRAGRKWDIIWYGRGGVLGSWQSASLSAALEDCQRRGRGR